MHCEHKANNPLYKFIQVIANYDIVNRARTDNRHNIDKAEMSFTRKDNEHQSMQHEMATWTTYSKVKRNETTIIETKVEKDNYDGDVSNYNNSDTTKWHGTKIIVIEASMMITLTLTSTIRLTITLTRRIVTKD